MNQLTALNQAIKNALSNEENKHIIMVLSSKYKYYMDEWAIENCVLHAIWKCLLRHNPEYNTKFSSSLYRYIEWECKNYIRENYRYTDNFELLEAKDATTTIEVNDCLSQLSGINRDILKQYHYEGMTIREIAESNGYTKTTAHNKIIQAQLEFKKLWNTNYYVVQKI